MRHYREDRVSENTTLNSSDLSTLSSARLESLPDSLSGDLRQPFASWGAAGAVVARMQNAGDKLAAGLAEASPFLRAFLADPRRVSAVAPSGRALATAITAEISPHSAPVIELGPGTGAFTRRLIERGIPQDQLVLIESGNEFAQLLQARYPDARVLRMDATHLRHTPLFDGVQAGAAVSGLPLLSMSARQMIAILNGAFVSPAAGWRFLPIHLRAALPGAARDPGAARPQGCAHRAGPRQCSAGRSLSHHPQPGLAIAV